MFNWWKKKDINTPNPLLIQEVADRLAIIKTDILVLSTKIEKLETGFKLLKSQMTKHITGDEEEDEEEDEEAVEVIDDGLNAFR